MDRTPRDVSSEVGREAQSAFRDVAKTHGVFAASWKSSISSTDETLSVSRTTIDRFREGVSEYLGADGAHRLLEAIEAEAILDEAAAEDVPAEDVARTVGRIAGRMVAKEATGYVPFGQVVEAAVARPVGEFLGEGAVAIVVEYGSVAAISARIAVVSDRVDLTESVDTDRIGRPAVNERASGVRDRLPDLGSTETVWEDDDVTSIPIIDGTDDD